MCAYMGTRACVGSFGRGYVHAAMNAIRFTRVGPSDIMTLHL